jgi:hypothetical protein
MVMVEVSINDPSLPGGQEMARTPFPAPELPAPPVQVLKTGSVDAKWITVDNRCLASSGILYPNHWKQTRNEIP